MMTTIATPRVLASDVPAYLLAATGTSFRGRTARVDRPSRTAKARLVPTAGLLVPAGVRLDATTAPRGTPMA